MTGAPQHPDLHKLVDQLNPAQADAVRAIVRQLVTPDTAAEPAAAALPRKRPSSVLAPPEAGSRIASTSC